MAASAPTPSGPADLRIWTIPDGWREEATTQQMRLATVVIDNDPSSPHEVAVSAFPGDVGGVEANLARWRGQAGVPADAAQDGSSEQVRHFARDGWTGYFARFNGAERTMLAGGIYSDAANRTWFVRLVTDNESADRLEDPLFEFLQSFGAQDEPTAASDAGADTAE